MGITPAEHGSAVQVSKIGYVGFRTPDVDRLVDYYTEVLDFELVERSADQAFLTTGSDHHCVVIDKGDAQGRSFVGYEIWQPLADAERRLTDAGYRVERRSDIAPGITDAVILHEPLTGVALQLIQGQAPSQVVGYPPLRPTKLGHVAAFTPQLEPMQRFYQDLLGFRWSDTIGDFFVFLRCNADHHAANFLASQKKQGMHHVAYEMRDPNHLISMLDHIARQGYRLHWGPGRHGPGHNLFTYHHDPDGNTIELFTQIDIVHDERTGNWEPRPWHETSPQGPRTWEIDVATVNIWGPVNERELEH